MKKYLMTLLIMVIFLATMVGSSVKTTATPYSVGIFKEGKMKTSWYNSWTDASPNFEDAKWIEYGTAPTHAKMLVVWFLDGFYPQGTLIGCAWMLNGTPVGGFTGKLPVNTESLYFNIHNSGKPMPVGTYEMYVLIGEYKYQATILIAESSVI